MSKRPAAGPDSAEQWLSVGEWTEWAAAKAGLVVWLADHGHSFESVDPNDIRFDHYNLGPGNGGLWGVHVRASALHPQSR